MSRSLTCPTAPNDVAGPKGTRPVRGGGGPLLIIDCGLNATPKHALYGVCIINIMHTCNNSTARLADASEMPAGRPGGTLSRKADPRSRREGDAAYSRGRSRFQTEPSPAANSLYPTPKRASASAAATPAGLVGLETLADSRYDRVPTRALGCWIRQFDSAELTVCKGRMVVESLVAARARDYIEIISDKRVGNFSGALREALFVLVRGLGQRRAHRVPRSPRGKPPAIEPDERSTTIIVRRNPRMEKVGGIANGKSKPLVGVGFPVVAVLRREAGQDACQQDGCRDQNRNPGVRASPPS